MSRRVPIMSLLTALCLVGVACSGGDDSADTSTAPVTLDTAVADASTAPAATNVSANSSTVTEATSPSDRVGCRVKLSGDVDTEFTAKDDLSAFGSDYYLSQAEIDEALGFFSDIGSNIGSDISVGPEEEPDFTPPPRPEGSAPLVSWFLLNCQGGDITISFYSNPNSTQDDVPFGKATYKIAAGDFLGADDPKEFVALVAFGANPSTTVWTVDEGASIEIDRFDTRGAEGTFTIPLREVIAGGASSDKTLLIEGSFDVTCKDGENCQN